MARVAIYPGSFDPPTLGHIDIVKRAAGVFDELVVAVGLNSDKVPFMPVQERIDALFECCAEFKNVSVTSFEGLLVDAARAHGSNVLVRGLRAITDYDYEFRIAMANRKLAPEIETVFLIASEEFSFLSSSVVREVAKLKGDYRQFVPVCVADRLKQRIGR